MQDGSPDALLRLRASMDRLMRVAKAYTDASLALYSSPAAALGEGLDVPPHMYQQFAEGEVRASLPFQLSKLLSLVTKSIKQLCGQSAWDGVVSGAGSGRLVAVEQLTPEAVAAAGDGNEVRDR